MKNSNYSTNRVTMFIALIVIMSIIFYSIKSETFDTTPTTDPISNDMIDISNILSTNPDFSILHNLIPREIDLLQLQKKGPYTFFAPTNDAFNKLKIVYPNYYHKLESKDRMNKKLIEDFIKSHIMNGRYLEEDIRNTTDPLKSLNSKNQPYSFKITDKNEIILTNNLSDNKNYDSKIIGEEFIATNGIVHGINHVLLPSNISSTELELK